MVILSCFPYQPPSMWPVQVEYNTESILWLKHVMHSQTKCQTGSIHTSRYYFDLCAVYFALNSPLHLSWIGRPIRANKNQFANESKGLRQFRDHRWKALGKEDPNLL